MSADFLLVLLALGLLLGVLNVVGLGLLWWRLVAIAGRVTTVEAIQAQGLSSGDVRGIYESLAELKGQMQTNNMLMKTVQQHLLENAK